MESADEPISTERDAPPGDGPDGNGRPRPEDQPGDDGGERGKRIDPSALEIDPVSDIEKDLATDLDAGGEARQRAHEELQVTAGVLQTLKYFESSMERWFDVDVGPDEQHEEARRDLAIMIGRIARERELGWLTEYSREIYAGSLFMVLYGTPLMQHFGVQLWNAYVKRIKEGR